MKIKVGIIGASGYTGYELIKLIKKHPKLELVVLNSETYARKKISQLYPDFYSDETFTNYSIEDINKMRLDCIFLALPHTNAFKVLPKLKCRKIIDLSADYRFNKIAVYGLPELFKEKIKKAKIIANPGCYATACLLTVLPLQNLAKYIVFDCKSGYSGAGKESIYAKDHNKIKENIVAYNLVNHRHKYEIERFLKTKLSFTPHVIDAFQGIMCTCHILLKKQISKKDKKELIELYENFYKGQPFVKIIKDKIPELHNAQKTNYCHIGGFEIDENNQLVIVGVIDNLIKGASGQAIQNLNLMFGFKEEEGLKHPC